MLKFILFVDDTTLYLDMNPSTHHMSLINFELGQVQTWITAKEICLNVYKKTSYMIIWNRTKIENINVSMNGQPIARTFHHKFLGPVIDDKLKFDMHINKLCSKVSLSFRVMRHISHLVPVEVVRNLYYTLIYSRLTYAISAWGTGFNSTSRRIESQISKAICLIEEQTNTNQLRMSPQFIQFKGVYDYFVLCKMFKKKFVK